MTMGEYDELTKALREHAKENCDCDLCPCINAEQRGYKTCSEELAKKAADAIEELQENWEYCSDMLKLAIRVSGLSMSALVQLYNLEKEEEDGKQ